MSFLAILLLQVVGSVASLVLVCIGLAVIFGMMRVINFAHGEFLMLGGYAAITANHAGISLWVSMLVVAPIVVGAIGLAVEWLIVRHLYGRMIDTMLATWGLSLALIGLTTVVFGNSITGVSAPLGSISIGGYSTGAYPLFLALVAAVLLLGGWFVLRKTKAGLVARGAMQDAGMAAALGIDRMRVYAITFGIGTALTGLAGGLLAPLTGVLPTIGAVYIAKAFITVISGGTAILAGTLSASTLLGSIDTLTTYALSPVMGEIALLATATVMLRILPRGITGRFFAGKL